jgi:hypothetical protein
MSTTEMSRDRIAEEKAKHLTRKGLPELWNADVDPADTLPTAINSTNREGLASNIADDPALYPDNPLRVIREPTYATDRVWGYVEKPKLARVLVESSGFMPVVVRTTGQSSDEFVLTSDYSGDKGAIVGVGGDICAIDRLLRDLQRDGCKQFPIVEDTGLEPKTEEHSPADIW